MSKSSISDPTARVSFSPLLSHEGLKPNEIVKDCLEKTQGLLASLLTNDADTMDLSFYQQLSLVDDLVALANRVCEY